MDCNRDEALRARSIAEKKMVQNDFEGARKIALKAKQLFPELENITQLITVCDIHCSAQKKVHVAEKDLYGILQLENVADEVAIRKQYRKLALVLHPDKNKFPGAEAAFKLIGEANMILSDKGKRAVYDIKCREPARASVTKIQNRQGNQSSYAQNKFKSQFSGMNHGQQSTSNPSVRSSFWTFCPFCNIKYEYYSDHVNRPLRCQNCSKLFIAHDIGTQGATTGPGFVKEKTQSTNIGLNRAQPPFSQQKEGGKWEHVKVNIQKDGQFPSQFAHQTSKTEQTGVGGTSKTMHRESGKEGLTKAKADDVQKANKTGTSKDTNRKRRRKMVVESSESESDVDVAFGGVGDCPVGSSGDRRQSTRQKQQVSYREDGLSPQKIPKVTKLFNGVEDMKKEEKSCNTADGDKADIRSMPDCAPHDDPSDSDSKPKFVDCPDSEFSNFDKDKEECCFAVDQIWACYDSVDGMPRYYAQVRKVYSPGFRLKITWLEPKPEKELEIGWAEEELPIACGKFVRGETDDTKDPLMFSHQIVYKKSDSRSFVIYPQIGEVWALFKDWDIKWSLEPENHKKFKYDIVEILSVHDDSISVAFMLKVKRFVSVFQRTIWAGLAEHKIPKNELLRFSHRIKSAKLRGTEKVGVPIGSFELDTASLPDDLEEYYYTSKVNIASQPSEEKVKPATNLTSTPKKQMNDLGKENLNLRRSPRGFKGGDTNLKQENENIRVNGIKEEVNACQRPDTISKKFTEGPKMSSPSPACKNLMQIVHDFSSEKQLGNFKVGQIWAFWENNKRVRQSFAQIKKIESQPVRLHVSQLKPCNIPSNRTIRLNACGLFKVSSGRTTILALDSFSHIVKTECNRTKIFNIFPSEQQIWAMYKKQDTENTSAGVEVGECDIVQVVETDESSFKVMPLISVPGYKSVFKAPRIQRSTRVVVIPRVDINRFSHQIPAFLFNAEKDGSLRGCWELDPSALTEN